MYFLLYEENWGKSIEYYTVVVCNMLGHKIYIIFKING